MKVSIFGLGYVGTVTAACLARDGHEVIGVDVQPEKVRMLGEGRSSIIEPSLDGLLCSGVKAGRIGATTDVRAAVQGTEVSLISVGTPPDERGGPNLEFVFGVCREIGEAVAQKGAAHTVVLRSTVPPGTLARCLQVLSEGAAGVPVHGAFNPEFLREGSAVRDYDEPPYTIIGTRDPVAEEAVRQLYAAVDAPVVVVAPEEAEMVKYVANAWHATKIAFANEVGRVAKGFGVDGRRVMALIAQDTKLNVSPAYMRPGFAYGGSCLPKDLGAIIHYAQDKGVPTPLLCAVPASNQLMIRRAFERVMESGAQRVALLGLAFKANTDDLRESPSVPLVKQLLGEGKEVAIFDRAVNEAHLLGSNLSFIRRNLPHFESMMAPTADAALKGAELVVVSYASPEFREALERAPKGTRVLDLAGLFAEAPEGLSVDALCW
jgi:GDP-mannose 6-dehydrogenase